MSIFNKIYHLPLYKLGYKDIPAYPVEFSSWIGTLSRLSGRDRETKQAKHGLSNTYTIRGHTASAYEFLFSDQIIEEKEAAKQELIQGIDNNIPAAVSMLHSEILGSNVSLERPKKEALLNTLALDDPEQFSLSLTTFDNIYKEAEPLLNEWTKSLVDTEEANRQFWPMIASHGLVYNLLIIEKITPSSSQSTKKDFQGIWNDEIEADLLEGSLYKIDMGIFNTIASGKVQGYERFTPGTVTLLKQDPNTKELYPFAITVANFRSQCVQTYLYETSTAGAWLYALQAAKTSITVYGIMLGHLYQWHLPTATMQMTMKNHLSKNHPIYQILQPQSNYLTGFNNILLLLWPNIAPPTSICSAKAFLELMNKYANGRDFFDDDPKSTLKRMGIEQKDFTREEKWDAYPIVKMMLSVWDAAEEFVSMYVNHIFTDAGIARDKELQKWINASRSREEGNIKGLGEVSNKSELTRLLTSIIYRATMHGASRLRTSDTPAFSFVANFPPCLQSTVLPAPEKELTTNELLEFLPKTGTIGEMIQFIYIFVFSSPYRSFIPIEGIESNLWFKDESCNDALIRFRKAILEVIKERYADRSPQIFQWPLNIET